MVFLHRAVRSSMASEEHWGNVCLQLCAVDYWQGWLTADSLCWWGSFNLHPCGTNQLSQALWVRPLPLASTFTSSPWKNKPSLVVYVAKEIFRGNMSPAHSLTMAHLKKKREDKATYLKALALLLGAPLSSKATQILLFLQLLCMQTPPPTPEALCACDPSDLMFPPWPP